MSKSKTPASQAAAGAVIRRDSITMPEFVKALSVLARGVESRYQRAMYDYSRLDQWTA
jgi:hypothetical protein